MEKAVDVLIVGAGHNGLVSAILLAREKNPALRALFIKILRLGSYSIP